MTRRLTWTQPRQGASALDEHRYLSHREPGWHRLLPDMGPPDPFGYERQVVEAMVRGLQALDTPHPIESWHIPRDEADNSGRHVIRLS